MLKLLPDYLNRVRKYRNVRSVIINWSVGKFLNSVLTPSQEELNPILHPVISCMHHAFFGSVFRTYKTEATQRLSIPAASCHGIFICHVRSRIVVIGVIPVSY